MDFKKIVASAAILLTVACYAQTTDRQVIENGGTGPFKSVAVGDAGLPTHVIYRP